MIQTLVERVGALHSVTLSVSEPGLGVWRLGLGSYYSDDRAHHVAWIVEQSLRYIQRSRSIEERDVANAFTLAARTPSYAPDRWGRLVPLDHWGRYAYATSY
jgi:hypothetical protein